MNLARPAGLAPAGSTALKLEFGRAALLACAGVLATLNAQAGQIVNERTYTSLSAEIRNIAGISAIIWFAVYAVLQIGLQSRSPPSSIRDRLVIGTVVALCFLPFALAAKAGLLLCGCYALLNSTPGQPLGRVSVVLLALTGPLIWGPLILILFAGPLLSLDAHLVAAVTGTQVDGNLVSFAGTSQRFLVGIPCSSMHNISLALVLWTTAAALFRVRFNRLYLGYGVAMVAWMIALNIVRLSLIARFSGSFTFLHDGAGADLFAWSALLGAGLIAFVGVEHAVRRQQ